MKNLCILAYFAVAILTLFACSGEDSNVITETPSSSSSNGTSEVPSSNSNSSSSSSNDTGQPQQYSYCVFYEMQWCSEGPFIECQQGGQLSNECPDFSASSSSNGALEEPSSSSNEEEPNLSSSSIIESFPCELFNPNEERLHRGKMKKQICDTRDGIRYVYVPIGKQTWMAEDLKYGCEGSTCERAYGMSYNFNDFYCPSENCVQKIGNDFSINLDLDYGKDTLCPSGWHIPSTVELEELLTTADPNFVPGSEAAGAGLNSAAAKLKVNFWDNNADDYGFAALPPASGERAFWLSYGFGYPHPLSKSWAIYNGSNAVYDAFQSYNTTLFRARCLKTVAPTTPTPETPPQNLTCSGAVGAGQICHLGKIKSYFTDERNNTQYPYVEIGGKTWMAKNLNFKTNEGSACYNNIPQNCETYGRLYNWNAMMDGETASNANPSGRKGICPTGWHLPSNAEWDALRTAIDGTGTNSLGGVGTKLKAKSGWIQNGTDDYGFAALPSSYGLLNAGNYGFVNGTNTIVVNDENASSILNFGTAKGSFFWGTGSQNANGSQIMHLGPTSENAKIIDNDKSRMYSVRCVKD